MYFRDKNELIELNKKIIESGLENYGLSRDHALNKLEGQGSSYRSGKNRNDSKKSGTGEGKMKNVEIHGEFDSFHIETLSQRMNILKQGIDE